MKYRPLFALSLLSVLTPALIAQDPGAEEEEAILEGHSHKSHAFNEGPRQAAYLMGGTGNISFPVNTISEEAQQFFDQGVGQLHGFWYCERQQPRSRRQPRLRSPDTPRAGQREGPHVDRRLRRVL